MRVLCLPINYGPADRAERLVRSLMSDGSSVDLDIRVVDNTDGGCPDLGSRLAAIDTRAQIVVPPSNLGYLGGARFGLESYAQELDMPDWVIVCNVDLEVAQPGFLDGLAVPHGMDHVGLVGPAVWSDRLQRSSNPQYRHRPSARKMWRNRALFSNPVTMNLVFLAAYARYAWQSRNRPSSGTEPPAPEIVYSVHGACLCIAKRFFDRGGSLNYPCFLFGEEIFLAESVRQLGLAVLYHPSMELRHEDHPTTGLFRFGKMARYQRDAAAYLARTYFAS